LRPVFLRPGAFPLADEGHASKALQKLTKRGIPLLALCVSMLGGLASLISSVVAPTTVYLVLVSVAGFATAGVWMSITAAHFFHRRNFLRSAATPQHSPTAPRCYR
jgi:S-methylmethionine transporter